MAAAVVRGPLGPAQLLAGMLGVYALLLAWGAFLHSPTFDEAAHLPAGIRHWTHGDFELFRVNPPLVRMVAALPVLLLRPEVDYSPLDRPATPLRRVDFEVGRRFIQANGNRSFWYYSLARLACIPLSLVGAVVCFRWACALYGSQAGLLAACLWCFSPNILGHGQMITPDVPAASLGVLAFYCFWNWLQSPDWPKALAAGAALGLAELTKSTWIIAFVLWPLLLVACGGAGRGPFRRDGAMWLQLLVAFLVALYVLNAAYGFSGTFTRLKDYSFVSRALAGPAEGAAWGNRFAGTTWGEIPVPLPQQYVLGIDYQKREFEEGTMSYLRGELRRGGWWYYYLYALAVKAPLGVLLLAGMAVVLRLCPGGRRWGPDDLVLLLPFVVLLGLVSSQTGINKHLRYAIPAVPFALVWISQVASVRGWLVPRLVVCSITAAVASSLWIYPHSLSYFNELAGGPRRGHEHLINSNIDWGQDLFFLKRLLAGRENRPLYLVFWSYYDPQVAGLTFALPPPREALPPEALDNPASALAPGVYAISINHVRGYPFVVPNGRGGIAVAREHAYSYFQRLEPVATAGYSLYVYVIPERPKAAGLAARHSSETAPPGP